MAESSEATQTRAASGRFVAVVLPTITWLRWPDGCAGCGRTRAARMVPLRVHPLRAGAPPAEPSHVLVPLCFPCRFQPELKLGLVMAIGGAVACLMTGTGKARHGVGPFLPIRWLGIAGVLLLPAGVLLALRQRPVVDIAGDGRVLRWSFPNLGFATRFAAAHGARVEPPEESKQPETEPEPLLDEHDAML